MQMWVEWSEEGDNKGDKLSPCPWPSQLYWGGGTLIFHTFLFPPFTTTLSVFLTSHSLTSSVSSSMSSLDFHSYFTRWRSCPWSMVHVFPWGTRGTKEEENPLRTSTLLNFDLSQINYESVFTISLFLTPTLHIYIFGRATEWKS